MIFLAIVAIDKSSKSKSKFEVVVKEFLVETTTPKAIADGHPNKIEITYLGKEHKLIDAKFSLTVHPGWRKT